MALDYVARGLILALLIATVTRLARRLRGHARELQGVARELAAARDRCGRLGVAMAAKDAHILELAEVAFRERAVWERHGRLNGRHTSLFHHSKDGIAYTARDGRLLETNAAFAAITGRPLHELLTGLTYQDLTPAEYHAQEDIDVRGVLTTGEPIRYEKEYARPDGTRVPVDLTVFAVPVVDGEPGVLAAVVRDLTATRAAEAVRAVLVADLERSNADLERFAYAAGHDLQEPLRVVAGFADLLRSRCEGTLPEKAAGYLARIVDGTVRMQAMIRALLDFSLVTAKLAEPTPVALGDALADALVNLGPAIELAGADVAVVGPLPTILGDRTALTLLLQNLVGNAVKYRDLARAPEVRIGADPLPGGGWTLRVADNGRGIEPKYAARVFEMFARVPQPMNDTARGTGLGLALATRAAERHGGRIRLESTLGVGSTFFVDLPKSEDSPCV